MNDNSHTFSGEFSTENRLTAGSVRRAANCLNDCIGFDGIHSNHLKFASPMMFHFFSKFFNSCFIHNHVPYNMLSGVIRPIVKNSAGNLGSSDNYREVMIFSNFYKLLEHCLLFIASC